MRNILVAASLAVVLCLGSQAIAARCGGLTNLVLCDDFDRYCDPAPTDPQGACDCRTQDPDLNAAPDANSFYTNWPLAANCPSSSPWPAGAKAADDLVYWRPTGQQFESWKCWHQEPPPPGGNEGYMVRVYEHDSTGVRIARHTRDLSALILANPRNTNLKNGVNGAGPIDLALNPDNTLNTSYVDSFDTAQRPDTLKGHFYPKFVGGGAFSTMVWYVELSLDDDHAPFDHERVFCPPAGTRDSKTNSRLVLTDGNVHASFAIGLVAWVDRDVCDLDTGWEPTVWEYVVYDGQNWNKLRGDVVGFDIPNTPDPHPSFLTPVDGWNVVSFAIGADYIEIRVKNDRSNALAGTAPQCVSGTCMAGTNYGGSCSANTDCGDPSTTPANPLPYTVARIPRKYTGPFNKISMGPSQTTETTAPACVDWQDGTFRCVGGIEDSSQCNIPTNPTCDPFPGTMCPKIFSGNDMYVDELALWDGTFSDKPAACCAADLTCSVKSPDDCNAIGGVFHRELDTCGTISPCCHVPTFDFNGDTFVDMDDFSQLQRCLNIGGGTLGEGCGCFDTNGNQLIDSTDVEKFVLCSGGPNVPVVSCPP